MAPFLALKDKQRRREDKERAEAVGWRKKHPRMPELRMEWAKTKKQRRKGKVEEEGGRMRAHGSGCSLGRYLVRVRDELRGGRS